MFVKLDVDIYIYNIHWLIFMYIYIYVCKHIVCIVQKQSDSGILNEICRMCEACLIMPVVSKGLSCSDFTGFLARQLDPAFAACLREPDLTVVVFLDEAGDERWEERWRLLNSEWIIRSKGWWINHEISWSTFRDSKRWMKHQDPWFIVSIITDPWSFDDEECQFGLIHEVWAVMAVLAPC